jgi:hypothetical protein
MKELCEKVISARVPAVECIAWIRARSINAVGYAQTDNDETNLSTWTGTLTLECDSVGPGAVHPSVAV